MKSPCHTIIFSENLLITGMSYSCPLSSRVSCVGHMQDLDNVFQVLGLPDFMPHSLCFSSDHWWSSQQAAGAADQAGT